MGDVRQRADEISRQVEGKRDPKDLPRSIIEDIEKELRANSQSNSSYEQRLQEARNLTQELVKKGSLPELLLANFSTYDLNGDGKVERYELEQYIDAQKGETDPSKQCPFSIALAEEFLKRFNSIETADNDQWGMRAGQTDNTAGRDAIIRWDDTHRTCETKPNGSLVFKDAAGHVTGIELPDGTHFSFVYDSAGNLIEWTDQNGNAHVKSGDTWTTYNLIGHPVESGVRVVQISFGTDGSFVWRDDRNGRFDVTQASDRAIINDYGKAEEHFSDGRSIRRDEAGRVVHIEYATPPGGAVDFEYNGDESIWKVEVTTPDGRTIEYLRDNFFGSAHRGWFFVNGGGGEWIQDFTVDQRTGDVISVTENNTRVVRRFDGSLAKTLPDGSTEIYSSNGQIREVLKNDLRLIYTNGRVTRVECTTDGSYWEWTTREALVRSGVAVSGGDNGGAGWVHYARDGHPLPSDPLHPENGVRLANLDNYDFGASGNPFAAAGNVTFRYIPGAGESNNFYFAYMGDGSQRRSVTAGTYDVLNAGLSLPEAWRGLLPEGTTMSYTDAGVLQRMSTPEGVTIIMSSDGQSATEIRFPDGSVMRPGTTAGRWIRRDRDGNSLPEVLNFNLLQYPWQLETANGTERRNRNGSYDLVSSDRATIAHYDQNGQLTGVDIAGPPPSRMTINRDASGITSIVRETADETAVLLRRSATDPNKFEVLGADGRPIDTEVDLTGQPVITNRGEIRFTQYNTVYEIRPDGTRIFAGMEGQIIHHANGTTEVHHANGKRELLLQDGSQLKYDEDDKLVEIDLANGRRVIAQGNGLWQLFERDGVTPVRQAGTNITFRGEPYINISRLPSGQLQVTYEFGEESNSVKLHGNGTIEQNGVMSVIDARGGAAVTTRNGVTENIDSRGHITSITDMITGNAMSLSWSQSGELSGIVVAGVSLIQDATKPGTFRSPDGRLRAHIGDRGTLIVETIGPDGKTVEGYINYHRDGRVERVTSTRLADGSIVYRTDGQPPRVTDVITAQGISYHYEYNNNTGALTNVIRRVAAQGETPGLALSKKDSDAVLTVDGQIYATNWPGLANGRIDNARMRVDLMGNLTVVLDNSERVIINPDILGEPTLVPRSITYQTNGTVLTAINGFVTQMDYADGNRRTFVRDRYDRDSISAYTYTYRGPQGDLQTVTVTRDLQWGGFYPAVNGQRLRTVHVDFAGTITEEWEDEDLVRSTKVYSPDGWSRTLNVHGEIESLRFANGQTAVRTEYEGKSAWRLPDGTMAVLEADGWHQMEFEHGMWTTVRVYTDVVATSDGRLLLAGNTRDYRTGEERFQVTVIHLDGSERSWTSVPYLSERDIELRARLIHDNRTNADRVIETLDGMTLADRMRLDAYYMQHYGRHIADEFSASDVRLRIEATLYRLAESKADYPGEMRVALSMLARDAEHANIYLQTILSQMTSAEWARMSAEIPHLAEQIMNNPYVSRATKEALSIFIAGSDATMNMPPPQLVEYAAMYGLPAPRGYWRDEVALNLVDIAIRNRDINMFKIAARNASPEVLARLQSDEYRQRLFEAFGENNAVLRDFLQFGQISLITLVDGNRQFGHYNKSAVEQDMLNAPMAQRELFREGYRLQLSGRDRANMNDAEKRAYDFYVGLRQSLDSVAWGLTSAQPWESDKWQAQLLYGDNNAIVQLANSKDGNLNARLSVIESMSGADWERYRTDPVFRALFEKTMRDVFTDAAQFEEAQMLMRRKEAAYSAALAIQDTRDRAENLLQSFMRTIGLTPKEILPEVSAFDYMTQQSARGPLAMIAAGASIEEISERIMRMAPSELRTPVAPGEGNPESYVGTEYYRSLTASIREHYPGAQGEALLAALERMYNGRNDAVTKLLLTIASGASRHDILLALDEVLKDGNLKDACLNPQTDADRALRAALDANLWWLNDSAIWNGDHVPLSVKLRFDTTPQQIFYDILHATDAELLSLTTMPPGLTAEQQQVLRRILDSKIQVPVYSGGLVIGYENRFTYRRDEKGVLILNPVDEVRLAIVGGGGGLAGIERVMGRYGSDVVARERIVNGYAAIYGAELERDVLALVGDRPAERLRYSQLIEAVTITDPREYVLRMLDAMFEVDSGLVRMFLRDSTQLGMEMGFHELASSALAGMDAAQVHEIYAQAMNLVEEMSKSKRATTENIQMIITTIAGLIAAAIPGGQLMAAQSLTQLSMILARAFVFGAILRVGLNGALLGDEYDFSETGAEDVFIGGVGFVLNFVGPEIFEGVLRQVGFGSRVAESVLGRLGIDATTEAGQIAQREIGIAVRNAVLQGGRLAPQAAERIAARLAEKGIQVSTSQLQRIMMQEMATQFGRLLPFMLEKSAAVMVGTGAGGISAGADVVLFHLDPEGDVVSQIWEGVVGGMQGGFVGAVGFTAAFTIGGHVIGHFRGRNGHVSGIVDETITVTRGGREITINRGESFDFQPGDRITKIAGRAVDPDAVAMLTGLTPITESGSGTAVMRDGYIEAQLGDKTYRYVAGQWRLREGDAWIVPPAGSVSDAQLMSIAQAHGLPVDIGPVASGFDLSAGDGRAETAGNNSFARGDIVEYSGLEYQVLAVSDDRTLALIKRDSRSGDGLLSRVRSTIDEADLSDYQRVTVDGQDYLIAQDGSVLKVLEVRDGSVLVAPEPTMKVVPINDSLRPVVNLQVERLPGGTEPGAPVQLQLGGRNVTLTPGGDPVLIYGISGEGVSRNAVWAGIDGDGHVYVVTRFGNTKLLVRRNGTDAFVEVPTAQRFTIGFSDEIRLESPTGPVVDVSKVVPLEFTVGDTALALRPGDKIQVQVGNDGAGVMIAGLDAKGRPFIFDDPRNPSPQGVFIQRAGQEGFVRINPGDEVHIYPGDVVKIGDVIVDTTNLTRNAYPGDVTRFTADDGSVWELVDPVRRVYRSIDDGRLNYFDDRGEVFEYPNGTREIYTSSRGLLIERGGRIREVRTWDGKIFKYGYDEVTGQLNRIDHPDGRVSILEGGLVWRDTYPNLDYSDPAVGHGIREGNYSVDDNGTLRYVETDRRTSQIISETRWYADGVVETGTQRMPGGGVRFRIEGADPIIQRHKVMAAARFAFGDTPQLQEFLNYVDQFEIRVVNPDQRALVYFQISRMLAENPTAPLSVAQRMQIATQMMRQLANPISIDQGAHLTCNVTTIEERLAFLNPAEYARVIADATTTGVYTTENGWTIDARAIGALRPDSEAVNVSRGNGGAGDRSWASKIFQQIAVNVYWKRSPFDPFGRRIPIGSYQFVDNLGEGLLGPDDIPHNSSRRGHPHIPTEYFEDIWYQLTGSNENNFVFMRGRSRAAVDWLGTSDLSANAVQVDDAAKFGQDLLALQEQGRLPAIVRVDAMREPFFTDSGRGLAGGSAPVDGGNSAPHVVIVTSIDYSNAQFIPGTNIIDPATVRVEVVNTWGRQADHTGSRAMTLKQLYDAMELIPPKSGTQGAVVPTGDTSNNASSNLPDGDIIPGGRLGSGSGRYDRYTGVLNGPDGNFDVIIHDFNSPLSAARYRQERAASVVSDMLGLDSEFPPTGRQTIDLNGVPLDAWVQLRVGDSLEYGLADLALAKYGDDSYESIMRLIQEEPQLRLQLEQAFVERLIFGDSDMHSFNFRIERTADGVRIYNVDIERGFTDSNTPGWSSLPTIQGITADIIADFSGQPLSARTREALATFLRNYDNPSGRQRLRDAGLSDSAIDAMFARARWLSENGGFPRAQTMNDLFNDDTGSSAVLPENPLPTSNRLPRDVPTGGVEVSIAVGNESAASGERVLALNGSVVDARAGSIVFALPGSTVNAEAGAIVVVMGEATVNGPIRPIRLKMNIEMGSIPSSALINVWKNIARMPDSMLRAIEGVPIEVITHETYFQRHPELRGKRPAGYPEGKTYADVGALYDPADRTIYFFTSGELSTVFEEFSHAIDDNSQLDLSLDQGYVDAVTADLELIPMADRIWVRREFGYRLPSGNPDNWRAEFWAQAATIAMKVEFGIQLSESERAFAFYFQHSAIPYVAQQLRSLGIIEKARMPANLSRPRIPPEEPLPPGLQELFDQWDSEE
ncbi:MAG TPA: RHS repeat domain-containing protein [Candidatus Obscuribacterales bacterium]